MPTDARGPDTSASPDDAARESGTGVRAGHERSDDDPVLCHQEPIRVPGSVQPHGALLALEPGTLAVRRASESLEALAGRSAAESLGRALADLFPAPAVAAVEHAARALGARPLAAGDDAGDGAATGPDARARELFELELEPRGRRCRCDAALHRAGTELVLEIDDPRPVDEARPALSLGALQPLVRRLHAARDTEAMCDTIVREIRALTGFDRVMVYRFHPDDHGEVVAESVIDGREPYLGLHYPESDIPVQARELYKRSWIRCIARVPYTPSPILPLDAPPLDLSLSHLRSVSPIHVEYLVNMGVGASMSISLLDGERLWGLVACHHGEERHVPADTRAACELLGTTFSLLLPTLDAAAAADTTARLRDVERRLLEQMADAAPFVDGAFEHLPSLGDLVAADGVASVSDSATRRLGTTPDETQIRAFAEWLEREVTEDVFTSEAIAARYAPAGDWPDAIAGVLVIEISRARGQYLMAFRRERERFVRWAGRPDEKPVVAADGGGRRLSPRRSFEAWRESVRGVSLPWRDVEVRCAETLRRTTLSLIVGMTEEVLRLNRELERSRESLHAFAHIAAHDLKEPLRGIANYAAFLVEDHRDALDEEALRKIATIVRLSDRGSSLTTSLLAFAEVDGTEERHERFALDGALDAVLEIFAPEIERRGIALHVARPLPEIVGDRMRMEQVLANLVGNAIKYTDRPDPRIEIAAEPLVGRPDDWVGEDRLDLRSHIVSVSDNGIGIPEAQRGNVFRLFKRLHANDAYEGGNGVGLAIVRRIVERQGGRVMIESTPGGGTTVRFSVGEPSG